jgi:hypothetical protein
MADFAKKQETDPSGHKGKNPGFSKFTPPDPTLLWLAPGKETDFCALLVQPTQEGREACERVQRLRGASTQAFVGRILAEVRRNPNVAEAALVVADLIEFTDSEGAQSLRYESLAWGRELKDKALIGKAILGLSGGYDDNISNPHTKIEAYREAFELIIPDLQSSAAAFADVKMRRDLLSHAEMFLSLIKTGKNWALGATWAPFFKQACEALATTNKLNRLEAEVLRLSNELTEIMSRMDPKRLDPKIIKRDIADLIKDAQTARDEGRYGQADLMLVSGMRRLGSSETNFCGSRDNMKLLVPLAMARVANFLAEQTADQDRLNYGSLMTSRLLCQRLTEVALHERISAKLRDSILELTNRPDLRMWLRTGLDDE